MRFIGKQISVVESSERTTIIIKPETSTIFKGLFGAWLFMWTVIGIVVLWYWQKSLFTKQETIILVGFMSFWSYFFIKVIRSFLWVMYGSEFIKIDSIAFSYKRGIGKYGKATQFFIENIQKLTIEIPSEKSFQASWENSPWVQGAERISFEYSGKLTKFGRKLNQKDGKLLFQLVSSKLEKFLKKK